jgi:hypothetical protein
MRATAWNNGSHPASGAGYGPRVSATSNRGQTARRSKETTHQAEVPVDLVTQVSSFCGSGSDSEDYGRPCPPQGTVRDGTVRRSVPHLFFKLGGLCRCAA